MMKSPPFEKYLGIDFHALEEFPNYHMDLRLQFTYHSLRTETYESLGQWLNDAAIQISESEINGELFHF